MHVSQIHLACPCSQPRFSGPLLHVSHEALLLPLQLPSFCLQLPLCPAHFPSSTAQTLPPMVEWAKNRLQLLCWLAWMFQGSGRGAEVKRWLLTVTGENMVRDHGHNSPDIYRRPRLPSLCQCPWCSGHCLALVFAPTAQPKTCFSTCPLSDLIPGWWAVGISTAFRRNPAPSSGRWCCSVVLYISQSPPEKQNL